MGLRIKLNLVLLLVFTCSLAITGLLSYTILQNNARDEMVQKAGIMMEAALSVRGYTVQQVKPLLGEQLQHTFLPQSVPAYAATEVFKSLRSKYAEYTYKEATLNPTNPLDQATDWETDLVEEFRNNPNQKQIVGERETPTGRTLYLARPIQVKNPACLNCHGMVDVAPKSMIKLYGTANGFGWKYQEVVGAQIVSVPMTVPINKARVVFYTFMGSLFGVFALIFFVLNLMLHLIIIKPLAKLSHLAVDMSTGNLDIPEFPAVGKDEVAVLARSFNRLRRSLVKAMKMIDD